MEKRALGFWDLVLYAVAMNLSIRWVASAAAAGPASIPIWVLAAIGFLLPLAIATAALAGRFEGEGAVYAWTREAFGPFWGFLCGWIYWACNLPFFSGLLFLIVSIVFGAPEEGGLSPLGFFAISSVLAIAVAGLHLLGFGAGKRLPAIGAGVGLALLLVLIGSGALVGLRDGPATNFSAASFAPSFDANGAILWATMVFAFGGAEGVALLRNEVRGGLPKILRALVVVGIALALGYIFGTIAMLVLLPAEDASRLTGLPDAFAIALERLGLQSLRPLFIAALALYFLGGLSAWFGVAARLPLAAGIDRFLPAAFGRQNPKTGAPTAAILLQTALVLALCAISQAGETTASAYDFLVAMGALSYTLPFAFLFAAFLKVQAKPAPPGAWIPPGVPFGARLIGWIGLLVSLSAIAASLVPSPDAKAPIAALGKLVAASLVLLASGAAIYAFARLRKQKERPDG